MLRLGQKKTETELLPDKMIKSKTEHNNTSWHFTTLDAALSTMANSGSWLYNTCLDIDRLKESLAATLDHYPVFAGRMTAPDCISTNNEGAGFEVGQQPGYTCKELASSFSIPEVLKAKFDIKAFKKGLFPVVAIKVTQISDGTFINIAINHVCADGATLYRFMGDWAKNYNGIPVSPVVFNQELFPKPKHNLKELTEILKQRNWCQIGLNDLIPMLIDRKRNETIIAPPFFVSYGILDDLRAKYPVCKDVGNHALLCSYLGDMIFNNNIRNNKYSVVSVVNLRGRAIYPKDFAGNAVMNIASDLLDPNAGIGETAALINGYLRKNINKESLEESFQLYAEAMILKAPFVPFDLKHTFGKKLGCILVNDFTSFGVYDICFGENPPVKAYPDDLPDNIKIWPGSKQENGVYILFRGSLAKMQKGI